MFGYSYIIHRQGLVTLDTNLVTIDTDEFFSLCRQAETFEKENNLESALSYYDKAAEIYQGDYFAEEPYVDWLARKREILKNRYIEILSKKAMLLEDSGRFTDAVKEWHHILETDPCYEDAYKNLMIIYADSGKKEKALELFDTCTRVLKQELDADPDDETLEIYTKIKAL